MLTVRFAAIFFACFLATSAVAGPIDDALAAIRRGDHAAAAEILQPAANAGNADAQYYLGNLYRLGWGVPKDLIKAVDLYGKAASKGNADAQAELSDSFRQGEGVPKDPVIAFMWAKRAAEQGNLNGMLFTSANYHHGDGVQRDLSEAYKWILLAAAIAPMYRYDMLLVERDASPDEIERGRKMALEFRPRFER